MLRELEDYNRISQTVPTEPLGPRRTRRQVNQQVAANVAMLTQPFQPTAFAASKSDPDTFTLDQALAQTENHDKWVEALEKEIRALETHGVWEEVPISEAKGDVIPTMFVMKIKRKPDGSYKVSASGTAQPALGQVQGKDHSSRRPDEELWF